MNAGVMCVTERQGGRKGGREPARGFRRPTISFAPFFLVSLVCVHLSVCACVPARACVRERKGGGECIRE